MDRQERALALGRHIAATRSARLGTTRAAYMTTRVSRNTWAEVERGSLGIRSDTYARIERGLGWPNGVCMAYLDGIGDLPEAPAEEGASGALVTHSLDDLPELLRSEFTTYGVMDPAERAKVLQEIVYEYVQESTSKGSATS